MGAVRKRLTNDELAIIADALRNHGGRVQWRNVSHWHDARVTSGVVQLDDDLQYVDAVNLATTRTVSAGQRVRLYSRGLRAVPAEVRS